MTSVVLRLVRKEKPLPPSKPPARPQAPAGVRVPGTSGAPGGMICLGSH
ncbi:MAG TPA: hypothetical protein VFB95_10665 [Candidatus Cryosericum sp.]|nr:hypothetical protein [Candidatus Cryosericum sp.]